MALSLRLYYQLSMRSRKERRDIHLFMRIDMRCWLVVLVIFRREKRNSG